MKFTYFVDLNIPSGTIVEYAGSVAPVGWLLCDGTSLLTASYPTLFSVISYTYGGSGANFNLPDSRGRVVVGLDQNVSGFLNAMSASTNGTNGQTLGGAGGAQSNTLSIAEMSAHTHSATSTPSPNLDHTHSYPVTTVSDGSFKNSSPAPDLTAATTANNLAGLLARTATWTYNPASGGKFPTPAYYSSATWYINPKTDYVHLTSNVLFPLPPGTVPVGHTHTISTGSSGSGTAHNNIQPSLILQTIIKI